MCHPFDVFSEHIVAGLKKEILLTLSPDAHNDYLMAPVCHYETYYDFLALGLSDTVAATMIGPFIPPNPTSSPKLISDLNNNSANNRARLQLSGMTLDVLP